LESETSENVFRSLFEVNILAVTLSVRARASKREGRPRRTVSSSSQVIQSKENCVVVASYSVQGELGRRWNWSETMETTVRREFSNVAARGACRRTVQQIFRATQAEEEVRSSIAYTPDILQQRDEEDNRRRRLREGRLRGERKQWTVELEARCIVQRCNQTGIWSPERKLQAGVGRGIQPREQFRRNENRHSVRGALGMFIYQHY
jgi:hypothetical protein